MLTKRLRELEANGVIAVTAKPHGRGHTYALTDAGRDLASVVDGLAGWGERWVDIREEHTDPGFALWAWCQVQLDREALPAERTVVAFTFPDERPANQRFWLLADGGDVELCYEDPGGDPAAYVVAGSKGVRGLAPRRTPWAGALRSGDIEVTRSAGRGAGVPRWNLVGQLPAAR